MGPYSGRTDHHTNGNTFFVALPEAPFCSQLPTDLDKQALASDVAHACTANNLKLMPRGCGGSTPPLSLVRVLGTSWNKGAAPSGWACLTGGGGAVGLRQSGSPRSWLLCMASQ
jgi:hypothetical protein